MKMADLYTSSQKETFYNILESRRDVRNGFLDRKVEDEVLKRILSAAHHAPSVGFMQPWNFIIVHDDNLKIRVKKAFLKSREQERTGIQESKKGLYDSLKLEGICEAPLNILVTCQRDRNGETGLGRGVQKEMDLFSTVCAIQNLWLAARVEGVGVGWVSIIEKSDLRIVFKLPENVEPVAYLCVGYVEKFEDKPELETAGWQERLDLADLIFVNEWGRQ